MSPECKPIVLMFPSRAPGGGLVSVELDEHGELVGDAEAVELAREWLDGLQACLRAVAG